jgi:hypothetical protein
MMRPFHILSLLLTGIILSLATPNTTKACFDTTSTFPSVICYYDTTNFDEFIVRISGFTVTGHPPGTFCTCAIWNNSPLLDYIDYVAFVEAGTNIRVDDFAQWYAWAPATDGWDSTYNIGWDGYLGQVEGNGTNAGAQADFIIRAHFGPGYAYIPMVNDLAAGIIGWGTWNDSTLRPNPDRWWNAFPAQSYFQYIAVHMPSTFFEDFDNDLLYTGIHDRTDFSQMELFPVPASDVLNLRLPIPRFTFKSVDIYDAMGRPVMQGLSSPTNELAMDVGALAAGTYFLRIETPSGTVTRRFSKVA